MTECPLCGLRLQVYATRLAEDTLRVSVEEYDKNNRHGLHNTLLAALLGYWRWCGEGRPAYQTSQYYYDPYHSAITYHARDGSDTNTEGDTYSFRIQLLDGPEGDTWWSGTFRINGHALEILHGETVRE